MLDRGDFEIADYSILATRIVIAVSGVIAQIDFFAASRDEETDP